PKAFEPPTSEVMRVEIPTAQVYANPNPPTPNLSANELAFGGHIMTTSATTGYPKAVLIRAADEDPKLSLVAKDRGNTGDTVYHSLMYGLWTAAGYYRTASVWLVGGTVIIDQRSDWLARLFDNGANRCMLTPVF